MGGKSRRCCTADRLGYNQSCLHVLIFRIFRQILNICSSGIFSYSSIIRLYTCCQCSSCRRTISHILCRIRFGMSMVKIITLQRQCMTPILTCIFNLAIPHSITNHQDYVLCLACCSCLQLGWIKIYPLPFVQMSFFIIAIIICKIKKFIEPFKIETRRISSIPSIIMELHFHIQRFEVNSIHFIFRNTCIYQHLFRYSK